MCGRNRAKCLVCGKLPSLDMNQLGILLFFRYRRGSQVDYFRMFDVYHTGGCRRLWVDRCRLQTWNASHFSFEAKKTRAVVLCRSARAMAIAIKTPISCRTTWWCGNYPKRHHDQALQLSCISTFWCLLFNLVFCVLCHGVMYNFMHTVHNLVLAATRLYCFHKMVGELR